VRHQDDRISDRVWWRGKEGDEEQACIRDRCAPKAAIAAAMPRLAGPLELGLEAGDELPAWSDELGGWEVGGCSGGGTAGGSEDSGVLSWLAELFSILKTRFAGGRSAKSNAV
jgi:hypothetical protein